MKFLKWIVILVIFSEIQAASHRAEELAHDFIALIGKEYGKALDSSMSSEFEKSLNRLYSPQYIVESYAETSEDVAIISSRDTFKRLLRGIKDSNGVWKVTDVLYVPHKTNTRYCGLLFNWWTQKKGVSAIEMEIQLDENLTCIEFVKEKRRQIYTAEEVS
jgi:hypothetical protein